MIARILEAFTRLFALFRRGRLDKDFQAELASHIEIRSLSE